MYFKQYIAVILVFLFTTLSEIIRAKTIFGNGSEYIFPCHCDMDDICDETTGECPTGKCQQLLPEGYGWTGPACQIGNLAYNKLAESNTVVSADNTRYNKAHLWHSADFLVDGILEKNVFGGSCSVVYTASKSELAWWMVDLGDTYAIRNVTLVNTENSVDSSYLETFEITVGNTTERENHTVCVRYAPRIGRAAHQEIQCDAVQVGRYLRIAKYEERNKVGRLPLCEVMIWGHKWLSVDWQWCADDPSNSIWCKSCFGDTSPSCKDAPCSTNTYGVFCSGTCGHCANNATCGVRNGHCDSCEIGWKPPLCQEECDSGFYGLHCLNRCGECEGVCDKVTGVCVNGCKQWYMGNNCATNIKPVDLHYVTKEQFYSLFEKQTSVILKLIMPEIAFDQYHSILLERISEHDEMQHDFRSYPDFTVAYNNVTFWLKVEVNDLEPNTQYWFRILVSRSHKNLTERGRPTPSIQVTTRSLGNGPTQQPMMNATKMTKAMEGPAGFKVTTIGPKSDQRNENVPYHVHVTSLVVSLVLIAIILIAIPILFLLYKRYKAQANLMFPIGRYVSSEEGLENPGFDIFAQHGNGEEPSSKTQDAQEMKTKEEGIYSVLHNEGDK